MTEEQDFYVPAVAKTKAPITFSGFQTVLIWNIRNVECE